MSAEIPDFENVNLPLVHAISSGVSEILKATGTSPELTHTIGERAAEYAIMLQLTTQEQFGITEPGAMSDRHFTGYVTKLALVTIDPAMGPILDPDFEVQDQEVINSSNQIINIILAGSNEEVTQLDDSSLVSLVSRHIEAVDEYLHPVSEPDFSPHEADLLLRLKQADLTATIRAKTVSEDDEFVLHAGERQAIFHEYASRLVATLVEDYELPYKFEESKLVK